MRGLLYPIALVLALPALAQVSPATLREAEAARIAAQNRANELARRAATVESDALKAEAKVKALSARIAESEAAIEEARQRETLASDRLGLLRESLARSRAPLSRMLAALQRLARRPMLLILLRPASIRDYVRTRAMIAAMMPEIRDRTTGLRLELAEMRALTETAAGARVAREKAGRALDEQRAEFQALGAESRVAARSLRGAAGEARREATLSGVRVQSIAALVKRQEEGRRTAAALAELTGPVLPPRTRRGVPAGERLPVLPVAGTVTAGFGERDAAGGRARGLTIAPDPGATVVAPLPGRIAFARPWRGYGTIVILRHANGLTSLVAGLDDAKVREGQNVARGATLGNAARVKPQILYELRRDGQPVHPLSIR